jgi:phosphatidyl-myo-inositol dimannoside synthase
MQQGKKKILFYYLSAFSQTGGIERFNRCFIKALNDISVELPVCASVYSMYDIEADDRYGSDITFHGFAKKRARSLLTVLKQASKYDVIVLGHINLAIVGLIIKLLNPRCQLVVITHGIEVWSKLKFVKKRCLQKADLILAVSHYTRNQLVLRNNILPEKIMLFPNTLDPFFKIPERLEKPSSLLRKYSLDSKTMVILTLSRLLSSEREKGYDKVIAAMPLVLEQIPGAIYILAGKYDEKEKQRIHELLRRYNIVDSVILPGFIEEASLTEYYCLADVFIMPSRKEGFGIVFLEALACGTSVIGGNQDGTVDALLNGYLGQLINPTRPAAIAEAIIEHRDRLSERSMLDKQRTVLDIFQFKNYKNNLKKLLKITAAY